MAFSTAIRYAEYPITNAVGNASSECEALTTLGQHNLSMYRRIGFMDALFFFAAKKFTQDEISYVFY